jgi:hypothetical protein
VRRKIACLAFATLLGGSFSVWPGEARAVGPVDIEGGGTLGYGTNPSHGPNPLGVGLGVRAGVNVYGLYAGVDLTYYFGGSGNCGGGAPNSGDGLSSLPPAYCSALPAEVSLSQMSVLYGVDVGYTLNIPRVRFLKFRPILELGDSEITRTGTVGLSDITTAASLAQYRSENSFYVQPGLTVLLVVDAFFFGVDANLLLIPGVTDIEAVSANADGSGNLLTSRRTLAAFTTHAQIGFRF